jgi:hypothetical protein
VGSGVVDLGVGIIILRWSGGRWTESDECGAEVTVEVKVTGLSISSFNGKATDGVTRKA